MPVSKTRRAGGGKSELGSRPPPPPLPQSQQFGSRALSRSKFANRHSFALARGCAAFGARGRAPPKLERRPKSSLGPAFPSETLSRFQPNSRPRRAQAPGTSSSPPPDLPAQGQGPQSLWRTRLVSHCILTFSSSGSPRVPLSRQSTPSPRGEGNRRGQVTAALPLLGPPCL